MTKYRSRPPKPPQWGYFSNLKSFFDFIKSFFDFIFSLSHEDWLRSVITLLLALFVVVVMGNTFTDFVPMLLPETRVSNEPEISFNVYKRNWMGPKGEDAQSDMFQYSKLKNDANWGACLAVVMPREVSPNADPFEVLEQNNLTPGDLIVVSDRPEGFKASNSGYLTFVVNEGILSENTLAPPQSKSRYAALVEAVEDLPGSGQEISSLPLVLFADNIGTFRVSVQVDGKQATRTNGSFTLEATEAFQSSGIWVTEGQHIKIEAEGRIHLSIEQIYNLARAIKPLIANHSPDLAQEIRDKYSTLKDKAFVLLK